MNEIGMFEVIWASAAAREDFWRDGVTGPVRGEKDLRKFENM